MERRRMRGPWMRWAALLLCGLGWASGGLEVEAQTTPNFEALNRDVVKVRVHRAAQGGEAASDETGTGLVVTVTSTTIRILTAAHVVAHGTTVAVSFVTDKVAQLPAQVLPGSSDALDLAMLEVRPPAGSRLPAPFTKLEVVPNANLHQTEHVWTVNGDWDPVPNTIVHLDHEANTQQFEYTEVSLGEGYSGGPIFDDAGRLVGIHTRQIPKPGYKLSGAVKMEAAVDTLEALQYARASMNVLAPAGTQVARAPAQTPQPRQAGSIPAQQSGGAPLWRDTTNNQVYTIRMEQDHIYITQRDGKYVGDLALKVDKKGGKRFIGTSSLSTCAGGTGYMELDSVSDSRIDGRVELQPAAANTHCGGVFGVMRSLAPVAFIREP